MPHLRGIELSLVADFGSRALLEYPHPDAASMRLLPTTDEERDANRPTQAVREPHRLTSQHVSISPKKGDPRVAVYVSSTPEDGFCLRYAINQSPPPSRFIFFKLLMNGRHIVSWGIDTTKRVDGTVAKALYLPSQKHTDEHGIERAIEGVESRYFHFLPGLESQTAAEDGGLIEVCVFRCTERHRIVAELEEHRGQEQYGISSPSGGLLQRPEDTSFYEYRLMDARDSPYATFCFHYRSMKYLEQLNLVPSEEVLSGRLSPVKPTSISQIRGSMTGTSRKPRRKYRDSLDLAISPTPRDRRGDATISWLRDESITPTTGLYNGANDNNEPTPETDVRPPSRESNATAQTECSPDGYLESSQRQWSVYRKSSCSSSLRSNCPSLTPSLKQYAESIEFRNENVRLSMAHPLPVSSRGLAAMHISDDGARSSEDTATSDYAASSSSSGLSTAEQYPSPSSYLPTTSSNLENHVMGALLSSPTEESPNMRCGTIHRPHEQLEAEQAEKQGDITELQWLRNSSLDDTELTTSQNSGYHTVFGNHHAISVSPDSNQLRVTRNLPVKKELGGSRGDEGSARGRFERNYRPDPPIRNWI